MGCLAIRDSDIPFGSGDHSLDVPASRVIDERIDAVPVCIPAMYNIRLAEGDGYVGVCMCGTVKFQRERRAVQGQGLVRGKNFGRNGCQRRRWEVEIPVLDPLSGQEMFVSVLMSENGCPFVIQPLIAVRMIEVTVGV